MKKIISVLLGVIMLMALTSCGGGETTATLKVFNCAEYIDETVIEQFEKENNVKVIYSTYDSNEDMYTKVKVDSYTYDIVFPSDYMISRMIQEDMLAKINVNNIPNFEYIDSQYKNLKYDPKNEYSVPYMTGTVGILYNTTMVDEEDVESWDTSVFNSKYKGKIFMLDSLRDAMGVALRSLEYDMNSSDDKEIEEAKNKLIEQKPLVLAYGNDEIQDKMIAGEGALAVLYSGQAVMAMEENEDLAYAIPQEGSNFWVDGMVVLKNSPNVELAEKFINFMCSTDIALKNVEYIMYSTPQTEAYKLLDEETRNDETRYPSKETLENCQVFTYSKENTEKYDKAWMEVKAAK